MLALFKESLYVVSKLKGTFKFVHKRDTQRYVTRFLVTLLPPKWYPTLVLSIPSSVVTSTFPNKKLNCSSVRG